MEPGLDDADAFVPGGQPRAEAGGEQPFPVGGAPVKLAARFQVGAVNTGRDSAGHRDHHLPRDSGIVCGDLRFPFTLPG